MKQISERFLLSILSAFKQAEDCEIQLINLGQNQILLRPPSVTLYPPSDSIGDHTRIIQFSLLKFGVLDVEVYSNNHIFSFTLVHIFGIFDQLVCEGII